MSAPDRRRAAAVAALAAAPFLVTAPFCGLYLDDYSFLSMLQGITPGALWTEFVRYVPGRNLHILFFEALLRLTAGSVPSMHLVGVGFDALNAALYYLLARRLSGLRSVALAAAAAFLVAANHGETHFWINNIPQVQVPTTLLLLAFLLATDAGGPWRRIAAVVAYAAALFTYDQAFLLWPLLLAAAWSRDPAPRRSRYAAAALILAALNAAHLGARYLAPYSSGGRPVIRPDSVPLRAGQAAYSVLQGVFPWPTSSHAAWFWSVPLILLALAAAVLLARAIGQDARDEGPALSAWTRGDGWKHCAVAGVAWTALAYAPNLFWYLSPRHNHIPSLGWCLSLAAIGAYAASRGRRAAALAMAAGILGFTLSAVSDVHEGTQWIDSRRLQDGFAAAVRRLPPPVRSVFLVGAPRRLRRAPGFDLPHDVIFAAGRALGGPALKIGDYEATPTRRGLVYFNDLTLMPASYFHWVAAEDANLLSYDPGGKTFACAAGVDATIPGGGVIAIEMRGGPDCRIRVPLIADVFLDSSAATPRLGRGGPRVAGLSLAKASTAAAPEGTRLNLEWVVETPPRATVAFLFRVRDGAGRLIFDGAFPSRTGRRSYPMAWPLVDDIASTLKLAPGRGLKQSFLVRRPGPIPAGSVLELDAYELDTDGRSTPAGRLAAPLSTN